jgi:hypothetical protein
MTRNWQVELSDRRSSAEPADHQKPNYNPLNLLANTKPSSVTHVNKSLTFTFDSSILKIKPSYLVKAGDHYWLSRDLLR